MVVFITSIFQRVIVKLACVLRCCTRLELKWMKLLIYGCLFYK